MTRDNWLACVATTLKTSRAKAGLTQCALAARIGRSTGTVANWEAGRGSPTMADLYALAAAFAVDPVDLLPAPSAVRS